MIMTNYVLSNGMLYKISNISRIFRLKCAIIFFFLNLFFFWPCEVLQLVFKEWFTTNHIVLLKCVANESKVHVSIAKV